MLQLNAIARGECCQSQPQCDFCSDRMCHDAGQPGLSGSADIPKPYNTARLYPQIGQLRTPAHVWLPWDVLEDVVRVSQGFPSEHVCNNIQHHCTVMKLCTPKVGIDHRER